MSKKAKDSSVRHNFWLKKALSIAKLAPEKGGSPHPDVQVGAVIVSREGKLLSSSTNRMARGIDWKKPERTKSGKRSLWITCAEQLAIAAAAKKGIRLDGAVLYLTLEPCSSCASLIIEAGIKQIIIPANAKEKSKKLKPKWRHSIEVGKTKLKEAKVRISFV